MERQLHIQLPKDIETLLRHQKAHLQLHWLLLTDNKWINNNSTMSGSLNRLLTEADLVNKRNLEGKFGRRKTLLGNILKGN